MFAPPEESAWFTAANTPGTFRRSEEHTSELQSRGQLVCRLLLEKKNDLGSARESCDELERYPEQVPEFRHSLTRGNADPNPKLGAVAVEVRQPAVYQDGALLVS